MLFIGRIDWITMGILGFNFIIFIVSHLTIELYILLNKFNFLNVILVTGRLGYLYWVKYKTNPLEPIISNQIEWFMMILPVFFLWITRKNKFNRKFQQQNLGTHILFFFLLNYSMYYYLSKFIYIWTSEL